MEEQRIVAQSQQATRAAEMIQELQSRYVQGLEQFFQEHDHDLRFEAHHWLRDEGRCGGGSRYSSAHNAVMDTASINFSQVQYEALPEKPLNSATALSLILHPRNPHAPSMHAHISWTELKSGRGYWRMMADLNPALPHPKDREDFYSALEGLQPELAQTAFDQGDRYFYIPSLKLHRGVVHYYLEQYHSGDFDADLTLAQGLGQRALGCYLKALQRGHARPIRAEDRKAQLSYHTVYFFQVLTLDRGTTSGLLVHGENDQGILASLPSRVSLPLLQSWLELMPAPQEQLLQQICALLEKQQEVFVHIGASEKAALAQIVREHYARYPEALKLQASGDNIAPTLANHGKG